MRRVLEILLVQLLLLGYAVATEQQTKLALRHPRQSFPDAGREIRIAVGGASPVVNVTAALEFWKG